MDSVVPLDAPSVTAVPHVTMDDVPPLTPARGDLWYNTSNGFLFIWYDDGNTVQWVVANPGRGGNEGPPGTPGAVGIINVSGEPPPAFPVQGQIWWDNVLGKLFVWYDDGNSAQWVPASPVASTPPLALTDVSPRTYGAVGDGVTDDTAALQAAINACSAAGGGNVNCTGGRWLIDSATLLIKSGVFLVGPWLNLGQFSTGNDYSTMHSVFIVNPAYTIKLNERDCGIRGMAVLRKGITTPVTVRQSYDLVQTFAGTGITVSDAATRAGTDAYLGYLFVAGFATGIASYSSRARMEWIAGDNTNGIYMTTSYDMQHLSHVHFWPFLVGNGISPVAYNVTNAVDNGSGLVRLTIPANVLVTGDRITVKQVGGVPGAVGPFIATVVNSTTIDLQGSAFAGATYTSGGVVTLSPWYRAGVGINFDNPVDWGQMEDCFTYAYAVGIKVNNSDYTTLVNCGTDNNASAGDTSCVGIWITGTCQAATMTSCKTAAQGVGLKIDTIGGAGQQNAVAVVGHRAWGNVTYAYEVARGLASFVNCEAQANQTIRIDDAAAAPVSFIGGDLSGVFYSYQSNASPRPSFLYTRGQQLLNPVSNGVNGSFVAAKFEGHMTTPTATDTLYKYYVLTDSNGVQQEFARESYRLNSVTAGALTGQIFWALMSNGAFNNILSLTPTFFSPLISGALALGTNVTPWGNIYTTGITDTGNIQVGTAGSNNNVTIRGTDNVNSLIVMGSAGTKFLYVKPETSTDTMQMGYFNGSINATMTLLGTVTFSGVPNALASTAIGAGANTQAFIKASSTANLGIYYGTGAPAFSAAKGSIYSCTNATTTTTRLYVNTDGAGTWATLTTSA